MQRRRRGKGPSWKQKGPAQRLLHILSHVRQQDRAVPWAWGQPEGWGIVPGHGESLRDGLSLNREWGIVPEGWGIVPEQHRDSLKDFPQAGRPQARVLQARRSRFQGSRLPAECSLSLPPPDVPALPGLMGCDVIISSGWICTSQAGLWGCVRPHTLPTAWAGGGWPGEGEGCEMKQ